MVRERARWREGIIWGRQRGKTEERQCKRGRTRWKRARQREKQCKKREQDGRGSKVKEEAMWRGGQSGEDREKRRDRVERERQNRREMK
jgi:hypothetical protein